MEKSNPLLATLPKYSEELKGIVVSDIPEVKVKNQEWKFESFSGCHAQDRKLSYNYFYLDGNIHEKLVRDPSIVHRQKFKMSSLIPL